MTTLTNMLQHVESAMLRPVAKPTTFNIIGRQEEDQAAVLSILTTATTTTLEAPLTTATTTLTIPTTKTKSPSHYEEESDDEEEKDLTNLTWLTELRNQTIAWPNAINPTLDDEKDVSGSTTELSEFIEGEIVGGTDMVDGPDKSNPAGLTRIKCSKTKSGKNSGGAAGQQQTLQAKRPTPTERYEMFLDKVKHDLTEYSQSASNYQTDTAEKPPFNYSHIIGMAMLENGRVTLQQICSWIEAKFAFFRVRKKWNNSIRHNLSLHHCFRKIDRNKYEKGKGGYWELGVDPKKCDRKRIRNRKSGQNKNKQLQTNSKATTATNPTATASYNFDSSNAPTTPMECDDLSNIASGLETNEELLLDEMDVQQNIDVSSCSHQQQQHLLQQQQQQQQQQVEDIFIANILTQATQDDETDATATMINAADLAGLATLSGNSICNSDSNMLQQQQYQLGTIIISASAADVAGATTAFNCLISDNYNSNNSDQQQQQNILYTEDDIPSACENVIVSSYLANSSSATGNLDEFSIDANPNPNKQLLHHHATTNSTHTTTIPYSQRPNVIVEPLEQPTGHYAAAAASASNALHSTHHATLVSTASNNNNNCDYANLVGDNFRPYIDGIEEAFQYLRSMDNNREDILDNLLDISVSDY